MREFKMRKVARYLSFQPFLGYNEEERAAFFVLGLFRAGFCAGRTFCSSSSALPWGFSLTLRKA